MVLPLSSNYQVKYENMFSLLLIGVDWLRVPSVESSGVQLLGIHDGAFSFLRTAKNFYNLFYRL
jgi:hypothetical protein